MDHEEIWTRVSTLVGTWEGSGSGEFPTIEPFSYREMFEVSEVVAGARLHYLQRTWRTNVEPEVPSHVETGFINVTAEGGIELLNSQGSDRVEALVGTVADADDGLVLDFTSRSLADDERMVDSWRTWTLRGDELSYTMGMRTTAVRTGASHLAATLRRTAGT